MSILRNGSGHTLRVHGAKLLTRIFHDMSKKDITGTFKNALKKYSSSCLMCMLQVKITFRLFFFWTSLFSFSNQVNLSQTKSIFFLIRSTCLILSEFGAGKKHRSSFSQYRNNHSCLQMLTLGLKSFVLV